MDIQRGRDWRPLADTAVAAQILFAARADWRRLAPRHGLLPRERAPLARGGHASSGGRARGKSSLDDFCRLFHGAPGGPPAVMPYTFRRRLRGAQPGRAPRLERFWTARLESTALEGAARRHRGERLEARLRTDAHGDAAAPPRRPTASWTRASRSASPCDDDGDIPDVDPRLPGRKRRRRAGMQARGRQRAPLTPAICCATRSATRRRAPRRAAPRERRRPSRPTGSSTRAASDIRASSATRPGPTCSRRSPRRSFRASAADPVTAASAGSASAVFAGLILSRRGRARARAARGLDLPGRLGRRARVRGISAPPSAIETRYAREFPRSARRPPTTRSSASATPTPRTASGRWSSSGASAAGRLAEILGPKLVDDGPLPAHRRLPPRGRVGAGRPSPPATRRASRPTPRASTRSSPRTRARPPEFRLLRVAPEPFDAVDCLVWVKMMAWDLAGQRARRDPPRPLRSPRSAPNGRAQLFSRGPASRRSSATTSGRRSPPPRPRRSAAGAATFRRSQTGGALDARLRPRSTPLGFGGESVGSNSWVVAGSRTRSGLPLLANDPHLGLRTPSRLLPRAPRGAGALGRGRDAARASPASSSAATPDRLGPHERSSPTSRTSSSSSPIPRTRRATCTAGRSLPFETRTETIPVRGARGRRARRALHGPRPDRDGRAGGRRDASGSPVALRWTGLDPDDRTAESFLAHRRRSRLDEFLAAARAPPRARRRTSFTPTWTGTSATRRPGAIPIRPRSDGLLPVSGDGDGRLVGIRSPSSVCPARSTRRGASSSTANNRVVSERYPWPFSRDWPEPYRARRIEDRSSRVPRLAADDDARDPARPRLLPGARRCCRCSSTRGRPTRASARALATAPRLELRLRAGLRRRPRSTPPGTRSSRQMPEDELGEPAARRRAVAIPDRTRSRRTRRGATTSGRRRRETCAEFKTAALATRRRDPLGRASGPIPPRWRWERLHRARFPHAVSTACPCSRTFFSPRDRARAATPRRSTSAPTGGTGRSG